MSKNLLAAISLAVLTACGGGGNDVAIQPLTVVPDNPGPQTDVAVNPVAQSRIYLPGDPQYMTIVPAQSKQYTDHGEEVLVFPYRDLSPATVSSYIATGLADGATYQYCYDEMFWVGGAINIGYAETNINSVAAQLRASGFKVAVSILPGVILSGGFALASPNSYDAIGIDIYPSNFLAENPALQATYSDSLPNKYLSLLLDATAKLRALGYVGEIWYIYQDTNSNYIGFGPISWTTDMKTKQYNAVRAAPYNGIVGLVAFNV
jgi:hypothetical protein